MIQKNISVNDNFWKSSKRSHSPFGQMELPLGGDVPSNSGVHVVAMEAMHGAEFVGLLRQIGPRAVFDLRELGIFNIPGATRQSIFRELRRLESRYIESPMPWSDMNLNDYSSNFVTTASMLRRLFKREGSPSVFVVSNEAQREFTVRLLLAKA